MAKWNTDVIHKPESINNGNQYEIKDRPTREQLNALAENSFYASKTSKEAIETAKLAEEKIDEFIETKGDSVVTINGVPQPTWSADFAESERQKTLNLLNFDKLTNTVANMGSVSYDYENKTITFTGATAGDQFLNIIEDLQLKPNTTYTMSVTATQHHQIYAYVEGVYHDNTGGVGRSSLTFTTGSTGKITLRLDNEAGAGSTCVFSELMLNEGDTALPYEDYYGEIVHSKKLNENMLGIPSNDNWITISVTSNETQYKAMANGYVKARGVLIDSSLGAIRLYNLGTSTTVSSANAKLLSTTYYSGTQGYGIGCFVPVKKDDNVAILVDNLTDIDVKFIPAEEV